MPNYYEYECPLGHQVYEDDLTWCPTCECDLIPLRIPEPEDAALVSLITVVAPDDVMHHAVSLDDRNKDLLYGFNDDSLLHNVWWS